VHVFYSLTRIYHFSEVLATALAHHNGIQTSAHYTNWHPTLSRQVRHVFRNSFGTIVGVKTHTILPLDTVALSSQETQVFLENNTVINNSIIATVA
jgi:hypothetical protein